MDLFLGTRLSLGEKHDRLCKYDRSTPFESFGPLFIDSKNSETSSHQTPPSSGESTSRGILPSHGEKPAVRAGVRALQVQRGQQRRASRGAWPDRREYLCRAKFQYRGVDEAVA